MPTTAGTVGDPYITRLDGQTFAFGGTPGRLHNLYSDDTVQVFTRILAVPGDSEGRTYNAGVDVVAGPVKVVVLSDGRVHVLVGGRHVEVEAKVCTLDAPGHGGNTSDEPHPLQGVPHMNITLPAGAAIEGATGLLVDGDEAGEAARYVVEG